MGVPISSLPAASALTGAELLPVVQSGQTKRTTTDAIPYVPAGTGAITTTVQAKLRETVSVKDFGAKGDGVADDTAAIQAAINTGNSVWFPDGVYSVSSLSLPNACRLFGSGKTKAQIKSRSAAAMLVNTSAATYNTHITGLTLNGNSIGTIGVSLGVSSTTSAHHVINDCEIYGFTDTGVLFNSVSYFTIDRTIIHSCTNFGLKLVGGSVAGAFGITGTSRVINSLLYSSGTNVLVWQASHITFSETHVYNEAVDVNNSLVEIRSSSQVEFVECTFEDQGGVSGTDPAVVLIRCENSYTKSMIANRFINCKWIGNAVAGDRVRIGSAVSGYTGNVYKTTLDGCALIAPASGYVLNLIAGRSSFTNVWDCTQQATYDTPTVSDLTVNDPGSCGYVLRQFAAQLPVSSSGVFNTSFIGSITNPTVTVWNKRACKWSKNNNIIYFNIYLSITTLTVAGSGQLRVDLSGLPDLNKADSVAVTIGQHNIGIPAGSTMVGYVSWGANYLDLRYLTAGADTAVGANLPTSGTYLVISGWYPIV